MTYTRENRLLAAVAVIALLSAIGVGLSTSIMLMPPEEEPFAVEPPMLIEVCVEHTPEGECHTVNVSTNEEWEKWFAYHFSNGKTLEVGEVDWAEEDK